MKKSVNGSGKLLEKLKRLERENSQLKKELLLYKTSKIKSAKADSYLPPELNLQSFFAEDENHSGSSLIMLNKPSLHLSELPLIKKIQEIQDIISKTYKIASIISDDEGKFFTKTSNFIKSGKTRKPLTAKGLGFSSTLKKFKGEKQRSSVYYEKNGLWNICVPIASPNTILAYWIFAIEGNAKKPGSKPPARAAQISGIIENIGQKLYEAGRRKQMDEEIKMLAYMVKSISEIITITDFDDNLIFVNDAFISEYGYSKDEVLGKHISILRPSEIPKEIVNSLGIKTIEKPWRGELINKRKDGSLFPILLSTSVIADEKNNPLALVGIAQNILERKKIERSLRESERMWSDIINFLPDPMLVINTKGILIVWNKAAEKLTGFRAQHLLGKGDYEYSIPFYGDRRPMLLDYIFNEYSGGSYTAFRKENDVILGEAFTPLLRSKGAYLWGKAAALYDSSGKPFGSVEVIRDITSRKEMEIDLLRSKNQAEKADKLKSEFLTQISHEIRTPLNIILNYSSLLYELLSGTIDDTAKEMFNSIGRGGARLMRTVEMILNMSQALTGNIDLKPVELNIGDILKSILVEYSYQAQSKRLRMIYEDNSLGQKIIGDYFTISQMFQNLVDNAIKYTNSGEVNITIFITENDRLAVEIKDTGIGISTEYLPDLFNLFSQEEGGYTRRFEGNGLGLALVKRYTELNNASIKVKSKKREGSSFTIIFYGKD